MMPSAPSQTLNAGLVFRLEQLLQGRDEPRIFEISRIVLDYPVKGSVIVVKTKEIC